MQIQLYSNTILEPWTKEKKFINLTASFLMSNLLQEYISYNKVFNRKHIFLLLLYATLYHDRKRYRDTMYLTLLTDCRYHKIWNSHIVYQSTNWQKKIRREIHRRSSIFISLFIHYQIIIIGASTSIAVKGAESVTRLPLRSGKQRLSDTFHFLADNTRTHARDGALLVASMGCVIFWAEDYSRSRCFRVFSRILSRESRASLIHHL